MPPTSENFAPLRKDSVRAAVDRAMMMTMTGTVVDPHQTRTSLLSRLKNLDDSASWEEFFHEYARMVRGLARQRGLSLHEAEEVAQEVFQRVARTIQCFERAPHPGAFRNWLGRLTRWRAEDKRRDRDPVLHAAGRSAEEDEGTPTVERVPAPDDAEQAFHRQARQHLLDALFRQLEPRVTPKQLQIFQLITVEGVPAVEVARMYQMTPTHIYVIKHRVMQKLREELQRLPIEW